MNEVPKKFSGNEVPELSFQPSAETELIIGNVRFRAGTFLGISFDMRGFGFDVTGIGTAAFPDQSGHFTVDEIAAMERGAALKGISRQFPESSEKVIRIPPSKDMRQEDENSVHWEVRDA